MHTLLYIDTHSYHLFSFHFSRIGLFLKQKMLDLLFANFDLHCMPLTDVLNFSGETQIKVGS